jgi:uncharacterized protein
LGGLVYCVSDLFSNISCALDDKNCMELLLIFTTGLLLSLHCVGMCGGFVALLAVRPLAAAPTSSTGFPQWSRSAVLAQQLVFNSGRVATYTLLGATAGGLGSFSVLVSHTGKIQAVLMIAAGVAMLVSGLALAGFLRHWSMFKVKTASPQPWLCWLSVKWRRGVLR